MKSFVKINRDYEGVGEIFFITPKLDDSKGMKIQLKMIIAAVNAGLDIEVLMKASLRILIKDKSLGWICTQAKASFV